MIETVTNGLEQIWFGYLAGLAIIMLTGVISGLLGLGYEDDNGAPGEEDVT